jgi:hypothetical protein
MERRCDKLKLSYAEIKRHLVESKFKLRKELITFTSEFWLSSSKCSLIFERDESSVLRKYACGHEYALFGLSEE